MSKATEAPTGPAAAKKIDELVEGLGDWREDTLAQLRRLIHEAVPDVVETWKWMGSPVWEKDGILAVGNAHKQKVKLTFPQGAQLPDPEQVFNNGLGGKAWRAIDLREGDALDAAAFQALVRAAASYNGGSNARRLVSPTGRGPSDRRRFRGPGAQEGSKGVKTMTCRQLVVRR
jgi:hypothetical protein